MRIPPIWTIPVGRSEPGVFVGCARQYCYCREKKYAPHDDPNDFAYRIMVKENAPELLRRALAGVPVDIIGTGDYQAAEKKFGFSRRMLEVCLELGFPVSVLERSPLVLHDLDLLEEINDRARAVMMWSIIYSPDSAHRATLRQLERLASPPEKRFAAMEQLARAGILAGTCMMAILPKLCDDDATLQYVTKWTAEHAGRFVLVGRKGLKGIENVGPRLAEVIEELLRASCPPSSRAFFQRNADTGEAPTRRASYRMPMPSWSNLPAS